MQHECLAEGEPEVEWVDVLLLELRRDPRFDKVHQGQGQGDETRGTKTKRRPKAKPAQEEFQKEREYRAREPGTSPHDAVGHALAFVKPLVEVGDARAVR